jgi:hypothetical protein
MHCLNQSEHVSSDFKPGGALLERHECLAPAYKLHDHGVYAKCLTPFHFNN